MSFGEGGDADIKMCELGIIFDHLDQVQGEGITPFGAHPISEWVPRGVTAQGQQIGQSESGVSTQNIFQLINGVVHQGEVDEGGQWLTGQPSGNTGGTLTCGTTCPVGN